MEGYRESPYQLNAASRAVARRTHEKPAAYRLALRQAEAACRLEPNIGPYLTTLGMAQYQLGQYPETVLVPPGPTGYDATLYFLNFGVT